MLYVREKLLEVVVGYLRENVGVFLGLVVASCVALSLHILLSVHVGILTYWGVDSILISFDVYRVITFLVQAESMARFSLLFLIVFGVPIISYVSYFAISKIPPMVNHIDRSYNLLRAKYLKKKPDNKSRGAEISLADRYTSDLLLFVVVSVFVVMLISKVAETIGEDIAHHQDRFLKYDKRFKQSDLSIENVRVLYGDVEYLLYQIKGSEEVKITRLDEISSWQVPHSLQVEVNRRKVPGTSGEHHPLSP